MIPHYVSPSHKTAHVLLCYKDFQSNGSNKYSHKGLGVNCLHTAKCLRAIHVQCDVLPINTVTDIVSALSEHPTITHVVIEAPFIPVEVLGNLVNRYHNVEFTCRTHSQVSFLTVEAGAIALIRQYIQLQDQVLNFRVSVNSDRLGTFLQQSYAGQILLLPNLYMLTNVQERVWSPVGQTIRVGCFGAIRIQKNQIAGAAAAIMIAATHKKQLNFYMSTSRVENGNGVLNSIANLFNGLSYATLIQIPWASWADFTRIIANMDLNMQLSTTETFNICTADSCNAGVPSVCSTAIDWVPSSYYADEDDPSSIAQTGWSLLNDPHAGTRGLASLRAYVTKSLGMWTQWLDGNTSTMPSYFLK